MKSKKIILAVLLALIAVLPIFAEYREGNAMSEAAYRCTVAEFRAYDYWVDCESNYLKHLNKPYKIVQKLSKFENRLLWKALEQYDYKAGEVYGVVIQPTDYAIIMLWVEIENDGSCSWYGWQYNPN